MKKIIFIFIVILALAVCLLLAMRLLSGEDSWICQNGQWVKHGQPSAALPTTPCEEKEKNKQSLQDKCHLANGVWVDEFFECEYVSEKWCQEQTGIFQECASACRHSATKDDALSVCTLQCVPLCKFSAEAKPAVKDLILLQSPAEGERLSSPTIIFGQAKGFWFFEADFSIKLTDENNNLLAQVNAQATDEWMTENFVPFVAELTFDLPDTETNAKLVLEKANPSGLAENEQSLIIPVKLAAKSDMITLKVYFANNNLDKQITCEKVYPVVRQVPSTQSIAKTAIEKLLKGPTDKEAALGFLTTLNTGIKLQKIEIKNNIAYVDFDEQLQSQVGGACRVGLIREQIKQTLLQFSSVTGVVISINGRVDDILQP